MYFYILAQKDSKRSLERSDEKFKKLQNLSKNKFMNLKFQIVCCVNFWV